MPPRAASLWIVLGLAWLAGGAIVLPAEWSRFAAPETPENGTRLSRFVTDWNLDTTPWLYLLAVAPVCVLWRGRFWSDAGKRLGQPVSPSLAASATRARRFDLALMVCVALTSLGTSAWIASRPVSPSSTDRFGDLPPAYHDEYSYLFQARTCLAGRLWFPSHPDAPELFDQMHVLNEGRFASRYFPAAGAWMAPFVALGHPYFGQWLAGALAAIALFCAGRELGGRWTGFLAGMAAALSPGVGLFSNLLLAHHPTLLGLCVFLAAFLCGMRQPRWATALLAGLGLAFAMLCRPMTAAGFALPFGAWTLWWLAGGRNLAPRDLTTSAEPQTSIEPLSRRVTIVAALGAPLVAGFVLLYFFNRSITGDGWTTPYQQYTDIYTPRHRYGFNNVVEGEKHLGPKVIEHYDRWAQNLTPALAVPNVVHRTVASLQWTLGIVPLAMSAVVVLFGSMRHDRRWAFVLLSIVSLHAAHVPYWFDGIMHWHYVFETAPLWCLAFAGATTTITAWSAKLERPVIAAWWISAAVATLATAWILVDGFVLLIVAGCLATAILGLASLRRIERPRIAAGIAIATTAAALMLSIVAPRPFWPLTRIEAGVSEVGFSRQRYAEFDRQIADIVVDRPALLLIVPDPADRSIDYVTNDPSLTSDVLRARISDGDIDVDGLHALFPNRALYRFDARSRELTPLDSPAE